MDQQNNIRSIKRDTSDVTPDFMFGHNFNRNQQGSKTGADFYTIWSTGPRKIWDHFTVKDALEFLHRVTRRDPDDADTAFSFGMMVRVSLDFWVTYGRSVLVTDSLDLRFAYFFLQRQTFHDREQDRTCILLGGFSIHRVVHFRRSHVHFSPVTRRVLLRFALRAPQTKAQDGRYCTRLAGDYGPYVETSEDGRGQDDPGT